MDRRRERIVLVASLVIAFCAYVTLGSSLAHSGIYQAYDVYFDADIPRVIDDLSRFAGNHYRTNLHPFFVILFNPLGALLSLVMPPALTSLILTIVSTLIGSVLLASILEQHGVRPFDAVLTALIYLSSGATLAFSAVPETYSFSATAILFFLATRNSRLSIRVPSAIIAFGTITSNALLIAVEQVFGNTRTLRERGLFLSILAIGALSLGFIQGVVYPSSQAFYDLGIYTGSDSPVGRYLEFEATNVLLEVRTLVWDSVLPIGSVLLGDSEHIFLRPEPISSAGSITALAGWVLLSLLLVVGFTRIRSFDDNVRRLFIMNAAYIIMITITLLFWRSVTFLHSLLVVPSILILSGLALSGARGRIALALRCVLIALSLTTMLNTLMFGIEIAQLVSMRGVP